MFWSPLAAETPFALTVDPYWILVSLVQFLILYWLLRRFLWGPVTTALATRAEKIREGLDLAEQAKQDRERLKQEVEEVRAEARAEADRIREKGRVDAQALHDQALAQLRGEVASMVVLAASRILGREISAEQH